MFLSLHKNSFTSGPICPGSLESLVTTQVKSATLQNGRKFISDNITITQNSAKNGNSPFFCLDRWLFFDPFTSSFPVLFSHTTNSNALLFVVLQDALYLNPQNCLTIVTSNELGTLLLLLQDIMLSQDIQGGFLSHSPLLVPHCSLMSQILMIFFLLFSDGCLGSKLRNHLIIHASSELGTLIYFLPGHQVIPK